MPDFRTHYVCVDCEIDVYCPIPTERTRCLTCWWLTTIEDPVERAKVAAFLNRVKEEGLP